MREGGERVEERNTHTHASLSLFFVLPVASRRMTEREMVIRAMPPSTAAAPTKA